MFLSLLFATLRRSLAPRMPRLLALVVALLVSCLTFGACHFTYAATWDSLQLATTVSIVWLFVSLVYIATQSFWATVLFNNVMATIGFLKNGITYLDGESLPLGIALDVLLIAIVVAMRRHMRVPSPQPSHLGTDGRLPHP